MPTKQTRRSISVRGTTYDSLRRYSEGRSRSMSDIVEELLAGLLGAAPPAKAARAVKPAGKPAAAAKPMVKAMAARHQRPARVTANHVVRASSSMAPPAPRAPGKGLPGRPAPTPARAVSGTQRVDAPKGDYRVIRF